MARVRDFKPVAPIDFRTAIVANTQAGKQFSQGFGAISDVLSGASKRIDAQDAIVTKDNDQVIRSNLESIKSLGDLNQAEQSGAFDIASLKQRFGSNYSQDALQKSLTGVKANLTKEAMNTAMGEYNKGVASGEADLGTLKRTLSANLPTELQGSFYEKASKMDEYLTKASPEDQAEMAYLKQKDDIAIDRVFTERNALLAGRQATLDSKPKAISLEVGQHFADVADPGGSVYEWFGNEIGPNDINIGRISKKHRELISTGLSDSDAAAIMVESWKATLDSHKHWLTGKGLTVDPWEKEISRRTKRLMDNKAEQSAINTDAITLRSQRSGMDEQALDRQFNRGKGLRTSKRTGTGRKSVGTLNIPAFSPTKAKLSSLVKRANEIQKGSKNKEALSLMDKFEKAAKTTATDKPVSPQQFDDNQLISRILSGAVKPKATPQKTWDRLKKVASTKQVNVGDLVLKATKNIRSAINWAYGERPATAAEKAEKKRVDDIWARAIKNK